MLRQSTPSLKAKSQAIGLPFNFHPIKICWNNETTIRRLEATLLALAVAFCGTTADAKSVQRKAATNKTKFVSGVLFNSPFQMVDAFVSSRKLLIRTAPTVNRSGVTNVHLSYRQYIEITFPEDEKLEGQTFAFKSYERQMNVTGETQAAPTLMISALVDRYSEVIQPTEPYTLALTFYQASKGMLPGSIVLQSNGTKKIDLRGYFYAKMTR